MATATKQKKKHIKAVRPKLRLFRANEPLYSVLMWGINHSVCLCTRSKYSVLVIIEPEMAFRCGLPENRKTSQDVTGYFAECGLRNAESWAISRNSPRVGLLL